MERYSFNLLVTFVLPKTGPTSLAGKEHNLSSLQKGFQVRVKTAGEIHNPNNR